MHEIRFVAKATSTFISGAVAFIIFIAILALFTFIVLPIAAMVLAECLWAWKQDGLIK